MPDAIGQRPVEGQMAVIVANDDGPRGVTLVRPGATSEEIAKATRRITRTPEQFAVIVGYGRSAAATARETAAALGGKSLHGYVDAGDTWQAWDAPSESYRPERLPDVATQAAFITGAQRPPGAVAELRLAPEPGYAVLTTKDARALDSTAPSFRVEVARRTFDAAVAEYPKVTPARLSTLGHLATSDVAARVAIVARACHSDTAEAVVVEALRLAPVEYRPAFAEIAVTATCANGKSARRARPHQPRAGQLHSWGSRSLGRGTWRSARRDRRNRERRRASARRALAANGRDVEGGSGRRARRAAVGGRSPSDPGAGRATRRPRAVTAPRCTSPTGRWCKTPRVDVA
ncbi:hypothetical protein [Demequina litorisediminis]|nr:hypothetical protein [Demequina litorisediminis]